MKLKSFFALTVLTLCAAQMLSAAEPLRVFIRAGVKTHGPNQHDHPRFLAEYTKVLADRGMKVDGALKFPTGEQLEKTDVVVVRRRRHEDHRTGPGELRKISPTRRRRGGDP